MHRVRERDDARTVVRDLVDDLVDRLGHDERGPVDEHDRRRAAARGLEPERAGAGEEVEHVRAVAAVTGVERREDRLAHPIRRGARARVGDLEGQRPGDSGDDARHASILAHAVPSNLHATAV